MSKYLYATVYEKFTGEKPPEPQNAKNRRRRGCGHPYRLRLNMQDSSGPHSASQPGSYRKQHATELAEKTHPSAAHQKTVA